MKELKLPSLKKYFSDNIKELPLVEFLFFLDLLHFRQTGRTVTNIQYIVLDHKLLGIEITSGSFDGLQLTRRELKLLNEIKENTPNPNFIKTLNEGEVNFIDLLDEHSISKEIALAVEEDEKESAEFRKLFNP